ncbi:branched-chain amino acid transport system II carrier protein [Cobetia marina]
MKTRLSSLDIVALGFMTFALFLGAGNIIFPPQVGQGAGAEFWPAALGFLTTGVGMPLAGIVAVAVIGGGLDKITSPLPKWAAAAFGVAIYLSIGPMFAIPRTGTVAFEMGMRPFIDMTPESGLALHSVVFFGIATLIALSPGKLMDVVGKWLTPLLIALLALIALFTIIDPQGPLGPVSPEWAEAPFMTGFQQGYLTMDALASMVFGILIVSAIKARGITATADVTRYTLWAGAIAAICLAAVYLPLTYMGATSHALVTEAAKGELIPVYVEALFGDAGKLILALVITLACLTTAVGLLTSCGEFFHRLLPSVPYRLLVIVMAVASALIANLGLSTLISVSIPVLVTLYPLVLVLTLLSYLRPRLDDAPRVFAWSLGLTLLVSLLDGFEASGIDSLMAISHRIEPLLPLASMNLGWLAPALAGLIIGMLTSRRDQTNLDPVLTEQR